MDKLMCLNILGKMYTSGEFGDTFIEKRTNENIKNEVKVL